jgi:gliding motility-associated peptidyl-prolyl isomerase
MKHLISILVLVTFISCEGPTPRHPVKRNTTSSIQASIERSKKLLAIEESIIKQLIAKDSINTYINSDSGSRFFYVKKNESTAYTAQPDDLVTLTYNILSLTNDTLYSMQDIGILKYKVDKQELFSGLRNSVKLLKENETATFLFPSSLGYGYPGDGDRIGINMPLKSTIAVLKIEKKNDSLP